MTDAQFTLISRALRDGIIPDGPVAVAVRAMMDEARRPRPKMGRAEVVIEGPKTLRDACPVIPETERLHPEITEESIDKVLIDKVIELFRERTARRRAGGG